MKEGSLHFMHKKGPERGNAYGNEARIAPIPRGIFVRRRLLGNCILARGVILSIPPFH
jgi:hypothetical protein